MNALASRIRSTLSSALLLVASCGGRTIENSDANRAGTSGHAGGEWANTSGGTSGAISAGGSTGAMTSSSGGGGGSPQSVPSAVCQVELTVVPSVLEFLIDSSQSMKAELAPGITRWNAGKVAELAKKLDAIKEADGSSILDNTVIFFGGAMHGSNHRCNELPTALIGGGKLGLKQDQHVSFTSRPLRDLHFTLLNHAFGIQVNDFGNMEAKIPPQMMAEIIGT